MHRNASIRDAVATEHALTAPKTRAVVLNSNYPVCTSTIDYRNIEAWPSRLQSGTTPQLAVIFGANGAPEAGPPAKATLLEHTKIQLSW